MKKKITIFVIVFGSIMGWAQKPVFTQAKLESARVYFNSAELTHKANLKLPKGTSEIVITNIADNLNDETIQIGATNDVTVMSVQYSNRFIEEYDAAEDSPLIKPVKDSIRLIEIELKKISNQLTTERKTIEVLDANMKGGNNQTSSTVEISKMVDYYKVKRNQLSNEVDRLAEIESKLAIQLSNLKDRLAFNEGNGEKGSKGKIVLHVMSEKEGNVGLQIKYLTPYASWNPFYELRVDQVNSPVKIIYKADVNQSTGLDWRNVKLSLTSGIANQSNLIPKWSMWFLNYQNDNVYKVLRNQSTRASNSRKMVTAEYAEVVESPDYKAETFEELSINDYTNINNSQLNVSFDISIPYTIMSNGKNHSVTLNNISIPAEYMYYAAPKLDLNAYLVASIKDYSNYNLLAGEANVVFEGVYVGKTYLDPENTEEVMKLNMGKDPRIVLTRTLVKDKSGTRTLSSKKEQQFLYDIVVRNTKSEGITIQIEDQYPLSSNKDIEVEVTEKSGASINDEKGIVKWDLKLKSNESKTLKFGYQVKYNKDQRVNL
ncbi:DUF4139 domain-containing protein [Myroides injenensis]|uniref:DUF4139 domain-containing protein n=1 Tax=Myroides injenensis TaxID=1183151 RepID=UPI00227122AD|nr:DUF4139 domain-containing protein [Myroides injenensis]